MNNRIFRLEGVVQHYAWGGTDFIPSLLHLPNPANKPYAEYWMGAHENAPSNVVIEQIRRPLNKMIDENPVEVIGEKVLKNFGRLPYLLKVLDVKDMLSIQVHPDKLSAEQAFEEENKRGIPLNAPNRNYKDRNHKPELMVALSEFWLLHDFKPTDELERILKKNEELSSLLNVFNGDYKNLYRHVMEMPQEEVNRQLQPLLDRIIPLYNSNRLDKSTEDFWAARAALTYNQGEKIDRGIFSIYFFNLVHLSEGEAIFQDAGIPHAYLEGKNVEIMANSDNVLRGGLTPKHVDVNELMKFVKFEAVIPQTIIPEIHGFEQVFKTPAKDFELSRFDLNEDESAPIETSTSDIFFVEKGSVRVGNGNNVDIVEGQSVILFRGTQAWLRAHQPSVVYRATVP